MFALLGCCIVVLCCVSFRCVVRDLVHGVRTMSVVCLCRGEARRLGTMRDTGVSPCRVSHLSRGSGGRGVAALLLSALTMVSSLAIVVARS